MLRRSHRPHGPAFLADLPFEDVARHRHFGCGLYGMCLQVAVRRRWPSFSCQPCSLFNRPLDPGCAGPARILPMAGR